METVIGREARHFTDRPSLIYRLAGKRFVVPAHFFASREQYIHQNTRVLDRQSLAGLKRRVPQDHRHDPAGHNIDPDVDGVIEIDSRNRNPILAEYAIAALPLLKDPRDDGLTEDPREGSRQSKSI
jgi:hypothetical protein